MIEKKGICIVTDTKNKGRIIEEWLEHKTDIRWTSGQLPTQISEEYDLFFIEKNPFAPKKDMLMGAHWSDLLKDAETNTFGIFKELNEGKYDIYVL